MHIHRREDTTLRTRKAQGHEPEPSAAAGPSACSRSDEQVPGLSGGAYPSRILNGNRHDVLQRHARAERCSLT